MFHWLMTMTVVFVKQARKQPTFVCMGS